jgi:hypothetical protein
MAKCKTKSKPEGYIQMRPGVRGGTPVITGTGMELDKQWKASIKRVARLRARTASILEEKPRPIKNLYG